MFYETSLSIPPLTLQSAPATALLQIAPGIIQQVEVFFPKGCAGLAHLRIFYWGHQLFPSNPDSYFTGDGIPTTFGEDLEITDPPYELELRGWSDDDLYTHAPIVRVQVTAADKSLQRVLGRLALGPSGRISGSGG